MYPPFFIIACNVHFFRDDVIFLNEKTCAFHVTKGKMVIFLINENKMVIQF